MAFLIREDKALRDIQRGWNMRRDWSAHALQSILVSYRRTVIGPFWICLQQIAFVTGISLLYSQLLKVSSSEIVPLAAFGVCFWSLITSVILNSSSIFIHNSPSIRSSTLPFTFYIFSSVFQQFMIFLHSALVLIPMFFITENNPRLICLISVPFAIAIALLNGFFLGLWIGPLSARFRDVSAAIPTILQIALFLSPIFWSASQVGGRQWIANYNPIAWLIETFRSPLLGDALRIDFVLKLVVLTCCNGILGFVVMHKVRDKISYWI
jgi:ABC-2 type transport system permease protein/lipopolysaccharide transport system permease protein